MDISLFPPTRWSLTLASFTMNTRLPSVTVPIFTCPEFLLWMPTVTVDPCYLGHSLMTSDPDQNKAARRHHTVTVVKITDQYSDVVLFSAAVTMLTASVWFLSGAISAVTFSCFALQLSLMEPLGSCPLHQHQNTQLCHWHHTAKTLQTTRALYTHLCICKISHVHIFEHMGAVLMRLDPLHQPSEVLQ